MMISEKKEKTILMISFFTGIAFAVIELFYSIWSHSKSVLMDAVYDSTELIFIGLILFLTPLFHKPISEKHPYGFYQVESIFLIIRAFMMLSVSLGVTVDVISKIITGGNVVNGLNIAIFQFVLAVASLLIYLVMRHINKKDSSPTIDAELVSWRLDFFYSFGLSLAFLGSYFLNDTKLAFITPYFDPIIAIIVMIIMTPQTIKILKNSIKDVFLFSPDDETVDKIKEICNNLLIEHNLSSVFYDITRTGRHLWVAVYFKTEKETFKVSNLKKINDEANSKVSEIYENITCEMILTS